MLTPEITHALQTLQHRSESVAAVMNTPSSDNRFTRALLALEKLAIQENIPIAIVGGLAAIRYGYPAVTEDIDVAIRRDDLDRLIRVAVEHGFNVTWKADSGWHTLEFGDVEINVVPEGGTARNDSPTKIPSPTEMGVLSGIDYADLPHWAELKISSWRRKDQTHLVEVLKTVSLETEAQIRSHLQSVHSDYVARFDQLAEEARQERQQENERR